MRLSYNEVELKRLEEDDIEMLRQWRNDNKISERMFYQTHISKQMQQQWFSSLKEQDYYFIVLYKDAKIGLIDIKEQDLGFYAGLFIYDESLWGTPIPIYASLALLQFAFEKIHLKEVKAKVRKENVRAISYNEFLGFEILTEEEMSLTEKQYLEVTKTLYNKHKKTS